MEEIQHRQENILKKLYKAQVELEAKKEAEIQRFLLIRGFKDIIDLREKGFDLIIEKQLSRDKYIISEQITLKLVKVESVENIECNININLSRIS